MFSDLLLTKSFPAGIRRVREHRGWVTAPCSSPARSTSSSSRCGRCSTTSSAPARTRRRHVHAASSSTSPDGRGPRPGDGGLRGGQGLRWPSRSPTPTPRRTCRCSRRSASRRREPRDAAGRPRPQAGLARRALRQGPGRPASRLAPGARPSPRNLEPMLRRLLASERSTAMKALVFERNLLRYAAAAWRGWRRDEARLGPAHAARRRRARAARARLGAGATPPVRHLRVRPGHGRRHARRAGSSRSCRSRSCPATRSWASSRDDGTRRVVVSRCSAVPRAASTRPARPAPRATSTAASGWPSATSSPACRPASARHRRRWSTLLVAHETQLHAVPDDMTDEAAVMVEPTACAVHAAAATGRGHDRRPRRRHARAAHHRRPAGRPRHAPSWPPPSTAQQRRWPRARRRYVVEPDEVAAPCARWPARCARERTLTGGAAVVDCVGSAETIAQALRIGRARRRGPCSSACRADDLDLTPLWQREVALARRLRLRRRAGLRPRLRAGPGGAASAAWSPPPTPRRYQEAIDHAAAAGPRGAVKIAFDLRTRRDERRSGCQARVRPRGRPFDAADAVLPRRAFRLGGCRSTAPASSIPPSRSSPSRTPTRPSATRC